jgi:hypothetical protein
VKLLVKNIKALLSLLDYSIKVMRTFQSGMELKASLEKFFTPVSIEKLLLFKIKEF